MKDMNIKVNEYYVTRQNELLQVTEIQDGISYPVICNTNEKQYAFTLQGKYWEQEHHFDLVKRVTVKDNPEYFL